MRIPNDPSDGSRGAFGELLRLQTEFQARLAEETIRYLRRLQGAGMPAAPGTVVHPNDGGELRGSGRPGEVVTLELEVENRQRVHSMVTPLIEPLVEASGVTWFPELQLSPGSELVPPGEVRQLVLPVSVPAGLPPGTYRGALVLQGFREGAVPITVDVKRPAASRRASTAKRSAPAKGAAKPKRHSSGSTKARASGGARTRRRT
jgi:hypothetical protein